MSRTITKIRIPVVFGEDMPFMLPKHGEVIFVGLDRGMPAVWFMSDSQDEIAARRLRLLQDDRVLSLPEDCFYVGTCVNASQIIHILEVR